MKDIKEHQRVLDTFTGPVERPLLRWLAAHLPAWVTPDILTGVGIFGSAVVLVGYALSNYGAAWLWLANLGFVINWFGDSLDGTLARYRKIERPLYGFFVDHVLDAYNELFIFLGLGLSPFVRFDLACLALIGYLMLSVVVYVRTCVKGEFTISYGKLGPTEARLLAISANLVVLTAGNPQVRLLGWSATVFDWMVIAVIGLLTAITAGSTWQQIRILAQIDPGQKT